MTEFAHEQGWSLEEGRIYFPIPGDAKKVEAGDHKETINHVVEYARELEMIV